MYKLIDNKGNLWSERKNKKELWNFMTTFIWNNKKYDTFRNHIGDEEYLGKEFGFYIIKDN